MSILMIVVGVALDFVLALMHGSVFYTMWLWLLVPTLNIAALSWTAAIMVTIVISFITGKTVDVDVEPEDYWAYVGMIMWRNVSRCIAFIILSFGLTFII